VVVSDTGEVNCVPASFLGPAIYERYAIPTEGVKRYPSSGYCCCSHRTPKEHVAARLTSEKLQAAVLGTR
jgi:hypothetical protein